MKIVQNILLVVFLPALILSEEEIRKDEGIYILTKDNFEKVIADNEFVLVEFYAPWCGHCKALAPEYVKAGKQLVEEESTIKLAKVDATEESQLAEDYGIRGYPTLKFFKNGKSMEYGGGRTAPEIVTWLKKKTGPAAKSLASAEEVKEFVEKSDVTVLGFFKDQESDDVKQFLSAAENIDDISFGITSDEAAMKEYELSADKIVLFKKFDDGRVDFEDELNAEAITKFVNLNSLPLVIEFNHDTAQKIFGGEIKSHLLLFLSKSGEDFEKTKEAAGKVSKDFKGEVLFVTIDTDEEDHQRILEFFGMKKENVPGMRLIKLEEDMTKYKPDTEGITEDGMRTFVQGYLDGKLKIHLLSQDLPEDWDKESVKILVSSNFDEVVMDKNKNVLVMFYAPWCGHCKQLAPIFEQLGDKFKDSDDVLIAKMDSTVNELESIKIQSFPTLKMWKKDTNEVFEFNGERTLTGMTKFIETGGEYGKAAPDDEEDIEEEQEEEVEHAKDEL